MALHQDQTSSTDPPGEITRLLRSWAGGDRAAQEELFERTYRDLKRIAGSYLEKERNHHTFSPSDLVHEAYLRTLGGAYREWSNRRHFFSAVALAMRRILVDYARRFRFRKRGGGNRPISLENAVAVARDQPEELLRVEDALKTLAAVDPLKGAIVELRFYGGLTIEECVETLGFSRATIVRQWRWARAWLSQQLEV